MIENQGNNNNTSIIFIDDEEQILSSLKRLFRKENYTQAYFSSPAEALQYLDSNRADVIISDMKMPEMSGEEFLKKANEKDPGSIKLILSGYEEKAIVLDMLASGNAHYYLMKPWDDTDLKNKIKKFCDINDDLDKKKLRKYLGVFSKMPAPTQISWNLNKLLNEENINIHKVTEEIEFHPYLITKILQIANSVSYGVRKEIISVQSALILIGIRQLRALIISFELLNTFSNSLDKRFEKTINHFWHESLKKAIIAKRIAEAWGQNVDTDLAFISALLSDIGYLVWLYTEPEEFNAFLVLSEQNKMSIAEAEENLFLFEHTKLGAVLLNLWNIPSKIIEAVENHHALEANDDITKILQIAGCLDGSDHNPTHDPSIDKLAFKFRESLKI